MDGFGIQICLVLIDSKPYLCQLWVSLILVSLLTQKVFSPALVRCVHELTGSFKAWFLPVQRQLQQQLQLQQQRHKFGGGQLHQQQQQRGGRFLSPQLQQYRSDSAHVHLLRYSLAVDEGAVPQTAMPLHRAAPRTEGYESATHTASASSSAAGNDAALGGGFASPLQQQQQQGTGSGGNNGNDWMDGNNRRDNLRAEMQQQQQPITAELLRLVLLQVVRPSFFFRYLRV